MKNDDLLRLLESQICVNDRYSKLQRINTSPGGGGNFSLVVTANDRETDKEVVLKFDHPLEPWQYRHECFSREAAILEKFKGQPNIIHMLDGIRTFEFSIPLPIGGSLPLQFRFISLEKARFSLFDYIHQPKRKYSPLRNLAYFREICKGVQRLHCAKFCHRDLKPQNSLVINGSYVVLGDMGTAKCLEEDRSLPKPTAQYHEPVGDKTHTAPELLCCLDCDSEIGFAADIYSLGAILFELFSRVNLSGYLYSIQEIDDKMIGPFSQVDDSAMRKQYFKESVGALEDALPLPNIEHVAPDGAVPDSIRIRLNRLYKSMTALDYRKRETQFNSIFLQIEHMRRILVAELYRTRRAQFKATRKAAAHVGANLC